MLWYVPCIPNLFRNFIMKGYWIFAKTFLWSWDDHVISVFKFICTVDYMYWFMYIELPMYLWNEFSLIMMKNIFDVSLDSACKYFVETFCICVYKENCSIIFFLCLVIMWFGYQVSCASWNKFYCNSLLKPPGPGEFFLGGVLGDYNCCLYCNRDYGYI